MGIHVMTYLVQNDSKKQNMSIHDLSNRFNVSSSYLSKILAKLSKAKLILSMPGVNGGYRLNKPAASISFYDVIVGRRFLMYLQDPLDAIILAKKLLKPNGLMIFQESAAVGSEGQNKLFPLHHYLQELIWNTITYEGGNIHIGSELYSLFRKARLDVIDYKEELVIQTPETGSDLAWLTNIMLPRIIKSGATTDKILDTGKLEKKLQEEIAQANTGFIRDTNFGICGVINQS